MNAGSENKIAVGLAVLTVLLVFLAACCIIKKLKRVKRAVTGSAKAELIRYAARAVRSGELKEKRSETPKSLSAMDRIYLPQIQRDFPEFNWNEFRSIIEAALSSFLTALDKRSPEPVKGHEGLAFLVKNRLQHDTVFYYRNIRIHRTVIKKYEKKAGTCSILAESAVEYWTDEPDDMEKLSSGKRAGKSEKAQERLEQNTDGNLSSLHKKQAVYETELLYVQDRERFGQGAAAVLQCPNCGAPVKNLGMKYCEYCQTAIEPLNARVWKINSVKEA